MITAQYVALFVYYGTDNKETMDVNLRVNPCEIFSVEGHACKGQCIDFKTGLPAIVFVWLVYITEIK